MRQAVLVSPEWRLLLRACASAGLTDADVASCHTDPSFDWQRLVRTASQHDIGPRLYHALRGCSLPDQAANAAMTVVESQYFATGLRNALLERELHRLLGHWRSAGVPAIVLKGSALTATVYLNRALRPMRDLDVLVQRSDMPRVEALMADSGYEIDPNQRDRTDWYYGNHYHLTFLKRSLGEGTVRCEVHWLIERPGRPFAIDTEGLWARAVTIGSGQHGLQVLSQEDTLLHLLLHVCKHRLVGGFRGFCDIAAVIASSGARLDWEQTCRRAAEWRIANLVYVPLLVTDRLLNAGVPAGIAAALAGPGVDERLIDAAIAEALTERVSAALFPEFLALCYGGSMVERTRTVRRVLARSSSRSDRVRRPWSSYPGRLRHVLGTYGAQLWRFSRQRRQVMAEVDRRKRLAAWLTPFSDDQPAVARTPAS